jgi:hypothetical protein
MIKPENDSSAEKSEARNQKFQTEPNRKLKKFGATTALPFADISGFFGSCLCEFRADRSNATL